MSLGYSCFNLCCIRISFEQQISFPGQPEAGVSIFVVLEFLSNKHQAQYSDLRILVSIFVVLEFLSNSRQHSKAMRNSGSFNLCCIRISFERWLFCAIRGLENVSIFVVLEFLSNTDTGLCRCSGYFVSIFVVLEFLSNVIPIRRSP